MLKGSLRDIFADMTFFPGGGGAMGTEKSELNVQAVTDDDRQRLKRKLFDLAERAVDAGDAAEAVRTAKLFEVMHQTDIVAKAKADKELEAKRADILRRIQAMPTAGMTLEERKDRLREKLGLMREKQS